MTFAQWLDWLSALLNQYTPRHTLRTGANTVAEETGLITAFERYEPDMWIKRKAEAGNPAPV